MREREKERECHSINMCLINSILYKILLYLITYTKIKIQFNSILFLRV